MTHKHPLQHFCLSTLSFTSVLIICILLLSGCSSRNKLSSKDISYSATVYLLNGQTVSGNALMPSSESKTVVISKTTGGQQTKLTFDSKEVDRIEFDEYDYAVCYRSIRRLVLKPAKLWVMRIAEGPNLTAYVGANTYTFDSDGQLRLGGITQRIQHNNSTMVVPPSFPVYMQKKGKEVLTNVALTQGINFEGSAFRSGVSRFLADDPRLGEYIRKEKLAIENIRFIVENYDPHRGNNPLSIDGIAIEPSKNELITADLNSELIFFAESAFPRENIYGTQFGIGLRTLRYKFFGYGGDIGYASAKYIDETKQIENHSGGKWASEPATDADFSKQGLFRFNVFMGAQLPLDLGKVYIVPAVYASLGGMFGTEYSTLNYGPMAMLDFGLKLKNGSIVFIGGGYRHNIPIKNEEDKQSASAPGFEAYKPYGNLLVRLSYKF